MSVPPHTPEHHELLQLVGKLVDKSKLIDCCILITIGVDGRPCIGGNMSAPDMHRLMTELGAAEDLAKAPVEIPIPKDN